LYIICSFVLFQINISKAAKKLAHFKMAASNAAGPSYNVSMSDALNGTGSSNTNPGTSSLPAPSAKCGLCMNAPANLHDSGLMQNALTEHMDLDDYDDDNDDDEPTSDEVSKFRSKLLRNMLKMFKRKIPCVETSLPEQVHPRLCDDCELSAIQLYELQQFAESVDKKIDKNLEKIQNKVIAVGTFRPDFEIAFSKSSMDAYIIVQTTIHQGRQYYDLDIIVLMKHYTCCLT